MLLSEAMYFGKSKELLKVDEMFTKIIEKMNKEKFYNPTGSKENAIIETELAKMFNFERISIQWDYDQTANAMTIPFTSMITPLTDTDYEIQKTSKGIRFKNPDNKIGIISIYTSIVHLNKLSGPEMTSIVLHEIGHNFYNTNFLRVIKPLIIISDILRVFLLELPKYAISPTLIISFMGEFLDLLSKITKPGRKILVGLRDLDTKLTSGTIRKMFSAISGIGDFKYMLFLKSIVFFLGPLYMLTSTFMIITTAPMQILSTFMVDGYRDEKFADNFATMHGYGPETASVQAKFETNPSDLIDYGMNKIPLVNTYYNTIMDYSMACMSLGDAHPISDTRIKDQKRLLEEALRESNISSADKKKIKKQIDDIDKTYEDMKKAINSNKKHPVKIFMRKFKSILGLSEEDFKEKIWKSNDHNWENVIDVNMNEDSIFDLL